VAEMRERSTKLIFENQLAMMEWMLLTGMQSTPELRKQIETTRARLISWEETDDKQ